VRQTTKLPQPLLKSFQAFIETHPPQQFNNHLRCLLMDYLKKYIHIGFPLYFNDLLYSLSDLFDLLDEAAMHQRAANGNDGNGVE
jgi:hypothetical protein